MQCPTVAASIDRHRCQERGGRPVRDRARAAVAHPRRPGPDRRSLRHRRTDRSMEESREEIDLLLDLMGWMVRSSSPTGPPTGHRRRGDRRWTRRARLIIEESKLASADDPLYVAFLGPLTDMASAILLDPEIVDRDVVVIWIGGVGYGGIDVLSGHRVQPVERHRRRQRRVRLRHHVWQVPSDVYTMVSVGYAELEEKIGGTSQAGGLPDRPAGRVERDACIRDRSSPDRSATRRPISLMLFPRGGIFRTVPAPRFGRRAATCPARVTRSGSPSRRRPLPARRHVRQDPQVRPSDGLINGRTDGPAPAHMWTVRSFKLRRLS